MLVKIMFFWYNLFTDLSGQKFPLLLLIWGDEKNVRWFKSGT